MICTSCTVSKAFFCSLHLPTETHTHWRRQQNEIEVKRTALLSPRMHASMDALTNGERISRCVQPFQCSPLAITMLAKLEIGLNTPSASFFEQ